ncbi:cytochrome P450 [Mycena vitilis]|nr:cytochrome P450 [Mycena vitilis]
MYSTKSWDTRSLVVPPVITAILVLYLVVRSRRSVVRDISGPPSPSWIFGNMRELMLPWSHGEKEFEWQKQYGAVYKFKGCFSQDRLMVSDPAALQYLLNSQHIAGSPTLLNMVGLVFGEKSLMGIRGPIHKRLRTGFNVGFTAASMRDLQPIFEKHAHAITQQLEAADTTTIDILPFLGHAALAAIAEAALSYSMDDLGEEYVAANVKIMAASSSQSPGQLIADAVGAHLPTWLLRSAIHLPTNTFKVIRDAKHLAIELGKRVVQEKREAKQGGLDIDHDIFGRLLDPKGSDTSRNALTGEDLIDQTTIIMIAGQDTTANTLAFGLLELARNPEFQERLRTEIHSTFADGNAAHDRMPLLNAFIKETLRFYPAEATTERMALEDTVIPLSESIITSKGERISQIPVRRGQVIIVGIGSYHRLESRWGKDAHQFRPSRWLEGKVSKGEAIGPYANLLTFLGGPHTCLGWRYALLEMQIVICELVGKFSFALPENEGIRVRVANTLVPTMSNGDKGMPLVVTRVM